VVSSHFLAQAVILGAYFAGLTVLVLTPVLVLLAHPFSAPPERGAGEQDGT